MQRNQILPTGGEVADAQRLTEGAIEARRRCGRTRSPSTTLWAVPLPVPGRIA